MEQITAEDLKRALPPHLKTYATEDMAETLNNIPVDPEIADHIRNNFISYMGVLREGKFKIDDYMNAVAYCTFKLMGYNNTESYQRTFPQRYQGLVARNASSKDISAYVALYNKGKLVTGIMEQAMIPTWLLNADVFQKAINHQMFLMQNAKSEMVQMQAAKSLMETLKRPETKEVNVNLGVADDSGINELRDMMVGLAKRQQQLIEHGVSTNEIAQQKLVGKVIEAEIVSEESHESQ